MNRVTCVLIVLRILGATIAQEIAGCDFYDTVNITGITSENGIFVYKNVAIPENRTGEYNYTMALFSGITEAPTHRRGCLCQLATCVLLCCEPAEDLPNAYMNISRDEKETTVNVLGKYVFQPKSQYSCEKLFLDKDDSSFAIKENGNLTSEKLERDYTKAEYCLIPVKINNTYYELRHPTILHDIKKETRITYSSVLRSISIFCMIMVITVYINLPKFRNDHGKSCTCYFICLTISLMLILHMEIDKEEKPLATCYFIGYCGYFLVMAMFLWLVVINFNSWRKTTSRYNYNSTKMFCKYNMFVWIVSTILLGITGTMEYITRNESIDSVWRPGVAYYYCWINTASWSAMVYYFGPISIMLTIIIVLSVITAKHIYIQNKELRGNFNTVDSQTNMTNQANFALFFRLFAISGVIWTVELIEYLLNSDEKNKNDKKEAGLFRTLFPKGENDETVVDLITCCSGILFFFVTIWKGDVLELICKRMKSDSKKAHSSTSQTEVTAITKSVDS